VNPVLIFWGVELFPFLFHLSIVPLGAVSFPGLLVWFSQAGLELASGSMGALLFSQCNMALRIFVEVGGSGCQCFAPSWWLFFFLPNVTPASQQHF
jgi:hypothetical protein